MLRMRDVLTCFEFQMSTLENGVTVQFCVAHPHPSKFTASQYIYEYIAAQIPSFDARYTRCTEQTSEVENSFFQSTGLFLPVFVPGA